MCVCVCVCLYSRSLNTHTHTHTYTHTHTHTHIQELAAKRAAQGDIITRLAKVDVDHRSQQLQQRSSQQEQGVNSANCQVSFVTALRDNKAKP